MYNLKKENVTHASSRSTAQNQCTWTRVTTFNKVGDKMYVFYIYFQEIKSWFRNTAPIGGFNLLKQARCSYLL